MAKPWRWASARRSRCSMPPRRGAWRWPRPSRTSSRQICPPHRGHPPLRQLDGRVRRARRGRRSLRHRARRRPGILPGARHLDPGRQGLAVDEDGVDRAGGDAQGRGAGLADRVGVRAGRGRAPHAHAAAAARSRCHAAAAHRPGCGSQPARRVVPRAGVRPDRQTTAPDCDDPKTLRAFVGAIIELRRAGRILAYHDRSDGGLFATLAEMAFAGHCGLTSRCDATTRVGSRRRTFCRRTRCRDPGGDRASIRSAGRASRRRVWAKCGARHRRRRGLRSFRHRDRTGAAVLRCDAH
jgi:hypothetical protein